MSIIVDIDVSTEIPSDSVRCRQLESTFDVPRKNEISHSWQTTLPISLDDEDWQIGAIIGPSGSGKSLTLAQAFAPPTKHKWTKRPVIDDFADGLSMNEITGVCQAVGFNTIPSWMKPFHVLSNGEQFRVDLARSFVEGEGLITIDEFTSVVDRQVAQIGSHAAQKYIRRSTDRKLVVASCHYDIIDWLQPDWVYEPDTMTFARRSVQPRPELDIRIGRTVHNHWQRWAPFHYLTADLNKSAQCFSLEVDGKPAAFAGVVHRPHPKARNVKGLSRIVTLPDWQGLGLAFVLMDTIASAYKTRGYRFRSYPAHPSLIRSFDASPNWSMQSKPGGHMNSLGGKRTAQLRGSQGGRPNAVFQWAGDALSEDDAQAVLGNIAPSKYSR